MGKPEENEIKIGYLERSVEKLQEIAEKLTDGLGKITGMWITLHLCIRNKQSLRKR